MDGTNDQPAQELWPWPMEERIRSEFKVHMTKYFSINPELQNFSVTNTVVPLINQYTAQTVSLGPSPSPPLTGGPPPVYSFPDLHSRILSFNQTNAVLNLLGSTLIDIFDLNKLMQSF
jgi:hypothetical protein